MFKEHICKNNCETYLQSFFNSISEGFALHEIICDEKGTPIDYRFLEANKAFEENTGLNRENILLRTAHEVHPSIEPFWIETYGNVALKGETTQFEYYSKELDKYFVISAFSPVKGQFITLFNDITELKKADEILKKHQILFDNAQDTVLYIKMDGSIADANKNALESYGYTRDELLKMKLQDIRHASTMDTYEEEMKAADIKGIVFESIHIKKDGTSFPVEVSAKSTLIGDERLKIHIIRDITERKKAQEKIVYLANYDSLTEIPNRSYLMKHLKMFMEQVDRNKNKMAVMLFDVDKFKIINDVYGHNIGDKVLKSIASRVKNVIGKTDFIGRFGGDEFVILQPFIKSEDDAATLAEKILQEIRNPVSFDDLTLNIRISIGISIFPDHAVDKKGIIYCADKAMYKAKREGGMSYRMYSHS